jgi:ADP-ribosylglycohydrolase
LRRSLAAILANPQPIKGKNIWSCHRPSAGAGAAARVALLGLWKSPGSDEVLLRLAIESALLTHGDPRAVAAAMAILIGVRQLAEIPFRDRPEPRDFLQRLIEKLRAGENFLISEYADTLNPERNRAGDHDISESLGVVPSLAREKKDDLAYRTLIAQVRNYSPDQPIARPNHAFSPLAVPMALYHALRAESFQSGLETVVNQGGDCDTLGTLVGALLGARFGLSAIPAEWVEELVARRLLEQRAEALDTGQRGKKWDDLPDTERRWTAEEEAGRAALFLACRKELEREERRKRARKSRRTSPASKAPAVPQGMPFAPPPELWLRDKPSAPAAPKQPLQRPLGGTKKRIPWKEERRRERRKRGDDED